MRVIAGLAKGRRLKTPRSKNIRPVLDQVKEAIFNILFDVAGLKVLDLFAGTGAMAIEALSRGAAFACFVDSLKEAIVLIQANLEQCLLMDKAKILRLEVRKAIPVLEEKKEPFDLIFVDPPYEKNYVQKTLSQLAKSPLVHEKTIVVVEHHPKEPIQEILGLCLTMQRKYGQTLVSFLKKRTS